MFVKLAATAAALIVGTAAMAAAAAPVAARTRTDAPPKTPVASSRDPLVIVVSLKRQKLVVYNRNGSVAESPISSGTAEFPTVTGVFSIIGKSVEHFSNLYDDAPMPYMQRLTWTGTAMHAGHLPGYPASHGCIRLPAGFAQRLYDMTSINTRVVVSNTDVELRPISHAKLFDPPAAVAETVTVAAAGDANARVAALGGNVGAAQSRRSDEVPMTAAAAARFAETRMLFDVISSVKVVHDTKTEEFKVAQKALNLARLDLEKLEDRRKDAEAAVTKIERARARLEAEMVSIGRRMETATTERALEALTKAEDAAEERMFELASSLEEANDALAEIASVRPDYDARIAAASEAQSLAADDLREAQQDLKDARAAFNLKKREDARYVRPVSVLISRKDQRVYVRQGFEPLLEAPVEITDAEQPIGSHVYTAMGYRDGFDKLDWSVMSLSTRENDRGAAREKPSSAASALDRVRMPEEARAAIAERMKPGSSIIITDDGPSQHFGEGTDFTINAR